MSRGYTAPMRALACLTTVYMMLLSVQSQEAMRYVASFDQLHRATLDGVRVIVLTDHLKLASAETIGGPGPILTLPESTDAILGMCDIPPPNDVIEVGATPRPGDCVITVLDHFVTIPDSSSSVWLDHLYIKVDAPKSTFADPLDGGTPTALVQHKGGDLFMSNCTLDGHSHNLRAVDVSPAYNSTPTELYVDDCTFTNFTSDQAAAVSLGASTSAALHRSSMLHNTIKVLAPESENSTTLHHPSPALGSAVVAGPKATLLIDNCSFQNNLIEPSGLRNTSIAVAGSFGLPNDVSADVASISVHSQATVFANPTLEIFDYSTRAARAARPWSAAHGFSISGDEFVQFSSEILQAVRASEIEAVPIVALPTVDIDADTDKKGRSFIVTALASLFAGIMLTSLVATVFVLYWWRKTQRERDGKQSEISGSFQHALVHGTTSSRTSESHCSGKALSTDHVSEPTLATHTWRNPAQASAGTPAASHGGIITRMTFNHHSHSSTYSNNAVSEVAPTATLPASGRLLPAKGSQEAVSEASVQKVLIPSNSLTVSRAAVLAPISVPRFNESTGAFGTTCRDSTTNRTLVSAQDVYDSKTMSLTSVGATTSCMHGEEARKEKKFLEETLDLMVASGTPFVMQYVMQGPVQWRLGSRGAVQFARSRLTGEEVAIKFFIDANAFRCEEAAYAQPNLRSSMSAVVSMEPAQQAKRATKPSMSDALPACVVYARGEPLDEWFARSRPDTLSALTMLCAVGKLIADMHAAGFVHRDIKPANILWQPHRHQWTLVDFGCAAPLGYTLNLTDCAVYVPPETLAKLDSRHIDCSVTADVAVDVWALGVITLEALSGSVSAAAYAPVDTATAHACDTQMFHPSSVASGHIHGEWARSKTVSVCEATHDDHATHVTQQLFAQLGRLSMSHGLAKDPPASLAGALRMLRMRIAACLAREPDQRPSINHVLGVLKHARHELQLAHACIGRASANTHHITTCPPPSYGSVLHATPGTAPPCSLSTQHPSHNQPAHTRAPRSTPQITNTTVATAGETPTYMPASPEVTETQTYDSCCEPAQHAEHEAHSVKSKAVVKQPSPLLVAPEVLASRLKPHGVAVQPPKVSIGEYTPVASPELRSYTMLPLEVTTVGSGADDSAGCLNCRPSKFTLAQKDVYAYFPPSSTASDTSSTRSHTGMSTISGKQPKIRSKRPLLKTVTSGVPTVSGNSPTSPYRSAAEAVVLGLSSRSASTHASPPPLKSKSVQGGTFGAYTNAPRANNTSDTSITRTLSPHALTQLNSGKHDGVCDSLMATDTPSGGQSPRSPCGHIQNLDSMHCGGQRDTALVTPGSSFEVIEGDMHEVAGSPTDSTADSFWAGLATLTASRKKRHTWEDTVQPNATKTCPSGGILRPSAFKTVSETDINCTADGSTQYTGVTLSMHDQHEWSDTSSVQLGGSNLPASRVCSATASFGQQQRVSMRGERLVSQVSNFTKKLMAETWEV